MKKILISLLMLLLIPFAFALTPCTAGTPEATTVLYTNLTTDAVQSITFGTDNIWAGLTNLTPTSIFNMNLCYNTTLTNLTNTSLYWADVGAILNVTNSSDSDMILGANNYSDAYISEGKIYWNLSGTSGGWNGDTVNVCYNKTFTTATSLSDLSLGYVEGTNPTYGGTKTWYISRPELTEHDWTLVYTSNDRACEARDSCAATQQVIYGGFGLIAVGIIVLSAFALIQISNGGGVNIMPVAIGAVAIGVVVMIGFVIISQVGQSICQGIVG